MRVTGLTRIVSGSRAARQVRRRCVHNADHLAHDTPLSAFVAEVVCDLGAALPRGATSPTVNGGIALHEDPCATCLPVTSPSNGGNCTIRGATRRRHADRMLLMVQNPHPALRAEESQGELRPGVARITDRVAHQAHVSHVSSRWSALWGPHRPGPRPDVSRVLWRVS